MYCLRVVWFAISRPPTLSRFDNKLTSIKRCPVWTLPSDYHWLTTEGGDQPTLYQALPVASTHSNNARWVVINSIVQHWFAATRTCSQIPMAYIPVLYTHVELVNC